MSPAWAALRPKTRLSYERALATIEPLANMPLVRIDRKFVFDLRDKKLLPKYGEWLSNYTVTVLQIILIFAHDRGLIDRNPLAERIRKIKIAREGLQPNRPWDEAECKVVLERAPPHLLVPIALAMCAGLRKGDFLSATLSALRDGAISIRTLKRGVFISIPIHPILIGALEKRPKSDAIQIALNSRGQPWTESGFNTSFIKFRKKLEAEGIVGPGLTPHGLRHTFATRLREAGADDRTIADILGQKSSAMARQTLRVRACRNPQARSWRG